MHTNVVMYHNISEIIYHNNIHRQLSSFFHECTELASSDRQKKDKFFCLSIIRVDVNPSKSQVDQNKATAASFYCNYDS